MSAAFSGSVALRIGSRGSQLALWQARFVASKLAESGVETAIEVIKTTGDHLQTASLVQAGGKGLFTKEIEEALLANRIDLAVHSLKDLPTEIPPGLTIAAIPERDDARDAMVGSTLDALALGSRVGTSSGRRIAQLRMLRPDLVIEPVRGNVDTRLRKLQEGRYEALVLAAAGLRRLGLQREIVEILTPDRMCPAPGQGALAMETRADGPAREICCRLNHEPSATAITCEREISHALGGGCELPIGAYAEISEARLNAMAVVISPDGKRHIRAAGQSDHRGAKQLGREIAEELLRQGARTILSEIR